METLTSIWKPLVAELTGTTLLVFCGTATMVVNSSLIERSAVDITRTAFLADPGLRFGMTLAALAMSIGPASGAHYNPVVSLAALICERIEWLACIFYLLAQLAGSILGAFLAYIICGGSWLTMPGNYEDRVMTAIFVELLISFLFVLVYLGVTDPERGDAMKDLGGVGMGLALAVGHWVGIPFSGGSMNPFRSLGSAIVEWDFHDFWIYLIAPPGGALLAALLYRFVLSGAKQEGL